MSILIKGMEMPESCYYCPFADGVWQKNKRCLINGKEMPRDGRDVQQNHINCPLIELPPHGRLIDADAFSAKIIEMVERQKYDDFYAKSLSVGAILREVVEELRGTAIDGFANAPTIIEAEGER